MEMQRAPHQEGAGLGKRIWMSFYRAAVLNLLGTRTGAQFLTGHQLVQGPGIGDRKPGKILEREQVG